ncbi:hypothetical protein SERLA73DRAFT_75755, partial [Serpula lacrymans var. lacrymans S7.3]
MMKPKHVNFGLDNKPQSLTAESLLAITHADLVRVPVTSNGETITAIVDSGSALNIVSRTIWENLIRLPMDTSIRPVVKDANGGFGRLDGLVNNVALYCGEVKTYANIFVGKDTGYDLLLGQPWTHGNYVSIEERLNGTYLVFRKDGKIENPALEVKYLEYPIQYPVTDYDFNGEDLDGNTDESETAAGSVTPEEETVPVPDNSSIGSIENSSTLRALEDLETRLEETIKASIPIPNASTFETFFDYICSIREDERSAIFGLLNNLQYRHNMSSLSITSDYVMRGHHGFDENHNLYADYVLLHAHLRFDQNHGPGRAQSIISRSGTAHIRFFPQTESFPIPTDEDINGPPSRDMNGQVNVTVE